MENNSFQLYDAGMRRLSMKKKLVFVLLVLLLALTACMPSQQQIVEIVSAVEQTAAAQVTFVAPTSDVDAIVQATFQALTAQALAAATTSTPQPPAIDPTQGGTDNIPTFTPEGGLSGSIAGQLSYPSEFIPSLAVIAFHINGNTTDYYYYIVTAKDQGTYQLDNLPPGNYYVAAYLGGNDLVGGYSQAVPCGLSVDCTDHSLIPVTVVGGQVTQGVNPGDWYAPAGSFPAYPLP
jgi:hypothetical protein